MGNLYGAADADFYHRRVDAYSMREAIRDWHSGRRGTAVKGFFKREWPVIAWLVSFALIAVGIAQVNNVQDKLRESAVAGCERQNDVREAIRSQITAEIQESRHVDYSEIFPDVPPAELYRLISESNDRLRDQRANIPNADCEAAYPQ
jgi:hypothetical protein